MPTDAHNGRISPLLLSPHQLKGELTLMKSRLSTLHALPIEDDKLIELYKIMSVNDTATKNEVVFEIKLPLVDSFDLFRIVPLITITPDN